MPMRRLSPSTTGMAPQLRCIIFTTTDLTVSDFNAVTMPVDITSWTRMAASLERSDQTTRATLHLRGGRPCVALMTPRSLCRCVGLGPVQEWASCAMHQAGESLLPQELVFITPA